MSGYLQLCLVLLIVSVNLSSTEPTRCDQLQHLVFSPDWFAKQNYYTVYETTWRLFQCTKVVVVNPRAIGSKFAGTAIVLRPNDRLNFELILSEDGKEFNSTLCSTGYSAIYNVLYANFTGDSRAFCVGNCNGASYKSVICFGASIKDQGIISDFLKQNEITGIGQKNCAGEKPCKITDVPYSSDI
ncbi:hypothetical protein CHUAL_005113 [Chamberlinius hualienensis]